MSFRTSAYRKTVHDGHTRLQGADRIAPVDNPPATTFRSAGHHLKPRAYDIPTTHGSVFDDDNPPLHQPRMVRRPPSTHLNGGRAKGFRGTLPADFEIASGRSVVVRPVCSSLPHGGGGSRKVGIGPSTDEGEKEGYVGRWEINCLYMMMNGLPSLQSRMESTIEETLLYLVGYQRHCLTSVDPNVTRTSSPDITFSYSYSYLTLP